MNRIAVCLASSAIALGVVACASPPASVSVDEDVPPRIGTSALRVEQPGYRAPLYPSAWPADMANLNRSNCVVDAGLPVGTKSADVRVDTVEMPFPVFSYTRNLDEVFVLGGLPKVLDEYVSRIDGLPASRTPAEPHLTKYNPKTGETTRLGLDRGKGFPYIGGALIHRNGYVYVVSQAYLYKVNPDTMTIAAGRDLPLAPFPGSLVTIYNGLSASGSGELLTKYFSGLTGVSRFLLIDPNTLEIEASVDYPGASPRLTVDESADGKEYLYHLNRYETFRFSIGQGSLTLDEDWISRYDPYGAGKKKNAEPTSPVVVDGRVYYTTNTKTDATGPMRIFWQDRDAPYSVEGPPLSGEELIPGSDVPGWSFFHLAIDEDSGIIVAVDQGSKALVAVRCLEDGSVSYLWKKAYAVSARPVIVSDRRQVYATDYRDGHNYLVMVDLITGEELLRVATPASRATVSTIVVSAADEVYFGSNEPGRPTGLFHRFFVP